MKKLMFALIGLIIIVVNSCKTVEVTSAAPPTEAQELKKNLTLWVNQIPGLTDTDPINFYNEFAIKVTALTPDHKYILKDGRGEMVNSSLLDGFTVPAGTEGALLKGGIIKEGNVTRYKICFFEDNDTYFVFKQSMPGSPFFLEKDAVVYLEGVPYPISLPTGYEKNRLFWDVTKSNNQQSNEKIATGRSVTGTKEIKIKTKK